MSLGEDLAPFFNTDEHAVAATIKTGEGVLVRAAAVIFSTPFREMPVGVPGSSVGQGQPRVLCKTADLAGVKKEFIFDIGGTVYRFVKSEDDGTGVSTAFLRKQ